MIEKYGDYRTISSRGEKKMRLCFFHGLESSPKGTKSRLLRQHYPDCWIPELFPDIYNRIEIVEAGMEEPMVIAGSSLGGLTAIMYAMKRPEMVKGLVLLAPAVGSRDGISIMADVEEGLLDSLYIPGNIPTAIIAGIRDELIPVTAIRALVQRSPQPEKIKLYEVDDDHMLHQSLDLMLKTISEILKISSDKPLADNKP